MEKKNNVGLVVLVIIELLIILGLAGFVGYEKFIKKDVCNCNNCDVKKDNKKEEKSLIKDKTKAIVYTNGYYKDKKVPVINIDSTDADKLNREIEEYVDKMSLESDYGEAYALSYEYFENKDILSIKMTITTFGSSRYYKTVNISTKTGKKVSNTDLLEMKKIKEGDFASILFEIYEKEQIDNGSIDAVKTQSIYGDEYTSVYDGTKNNIESTKINDFDMYLNKNGELCVVTDIYLIAGPERNFYIYNLDTNLREK
ncbi:MAG: hypothetical protein IJ094_06780 [Bacilli bacterium]|nr:hypothetical protein [Bacilli bacterium]